MSAPYYDVIADALRETMEQLEHPTDGLGRPIAPMRAESFTAARGALRLFVATLSHTKYEIDAITLQRLTRRAGL